MKPLRGVCIGTGYFSTFHYDAWQRIPEVEITAIGSLDPEQAEPLMAKFGIPRHYTDYREMLERESPDFVDVITPPESHVEMCRRAGEMGIHVICQKPLAPTLAEARRIVHDAKASGIRLMVHENFRFQPWHREIRSLLDEGAIGHRLHSLNFRTRTGDGWAEDAYLDRQPYFRDYKRLLVYETGVHFIDTFRYLAGEIERVYVNLRKLNPAIAGEDCGLILFEFASGAVGLWDANRYNETTHEDPRYTLGEFLVEGSAGSIRLYPDGRLTVQRLGETERPHPYHHESSQFGGGCCFTTVRHFIDRLIDGHPFETRGDDYLRTLAVQEAAYRSAERRTPVSPDYS